MAVVNNSLQDHEEVLRRSAEFNAYGSAQKRMAPMNLPSSHGCHDGIVDDRTNKRQYGVYYNDISFILCITTVYRLVPNLMREWSDK